MVSFFFFKSADSFGVKKIVANLLIGINKKRSVKWARHVENGQIGRVQ
jgi:hypothetical protein